MRAFVRRAIWRLVSFVRWASWHWFGFVPGRVDRVTSTLLIEANDDGPHEVLLHRGTFSRVVIGPHAHVQIGPAATVVELTINRGGCVHMDDRPSEAGHEADQD